MNSRSVLTPGHTCSVSGGRLSEHAVGFGLFRRRAKLPEDSEEGILKLVCMFSLAQAPGLTKYGCNG